MANKDKLLESAQKFLAKGQIPKAIGEYQKLIEAFPKDYRNRQKLAELLGREKRNSEAQPHYEAVAKNFAEMGFYLKAIAIYKQMQKIEPNRTDIYLRLAELNEKQGLNGNALNEYRSLLAFYDKNRMARETVGVLQKMIALDPENLGFRGKLIETYVSIDEKTEALGQLLALVKFLVGKSDPGKVVKLYEKFINLCPEDVEHRLPLAEALVATGQHDKALALLKSLLKQAPDHPVLLTALTDCHVALGNLADARLTCQHLLKDQQQDLALRERYVRICMAGDDYARALESLEESKELFSQGNRVEVLRDLYEALQTKLPHDARLQATLDAIYETTGETGQRAVAAPEPAPVVVEETADAAIVEAAISDVEHLDLVGDTTTLPPPVTVPPLGVSAASTKPAAPTSGLELELDLDLGLPSAGSEPMVPEPPAPEPVEQKPTAPPAAKEPTALSAQPAVAEPAPPLEIELDLGGIEELEVEPVPAVSDAVLEAPAPEETAPGLSLELELDLGGLEEMAVEPPVAEAAEPVQTQAIPEPASIPPDIEPSGEAELELELGGLETMEGLEALSFEVEPSSETEAVAGEEAFVATQEPGPGVEPAVAEQAIAEDVAAIEEPGFEGSEFLEPSAEVEHTEAVEITETLEDAEEFEELEELEEVEEFGEAEEVEEFEEAEELEELEELEEAEELAEAEEAEELADALELQATEAFAEAMPPAQAEAPGELEELAEDIVAAPDEAAAVPAQQLRDDLEEAEFYLRQGLLDDAERVVRELQGRYTELPELTGMLAEIEAQRQSVATAEDNGAVFDLMADVKDGELLGATDFLNDAAGAAGDEFSQAEAVEENEDAQSHFDLGIAYKEMGLLDDAIAEFSKAAKDPARRLDCLVLKGQCQVEMSDFEKAEGSFREALDQMNVTEEVRVALQYELGLLYEATGRLPEALEKFQFVADLDLFFRDVTDKLKTLRHTLGLDEDIEEAIAPRSNRDRISFV